MVVVEVRQGAGGGGGEERRRGEEKRGEEEEEKEDEKEEDEEEQATDIKSNNPHLAGGEKCYVLNAFWLVLAAGICHSEIRVRLDSPGRIPLKVPEGPRIVI